jgi:hypothetical protein
MTMILKIRRSWETVYCDRRWIKLTPVHWGDWILVYEWLYVMRCRQRSGAKPLEFVTGELIRFF